MDTGLEAIGTNAHELPMVYAAIAKDDEELREAPYSVLKDWSRMYGGNLLVILPDCFGTTSFLQNAPEWVADWKGARPDSKLPLSGARELIDWWKRRGRDPTEKLIVLSDAMDIDSIEEAVRALSGQVNLSIGWGTNLTNDFIGCAPAGADGQLRAISLVCKVVEADGRPAVKLSDNPKELLRFDLDNETETIRNYRERIRQAEQLGEFSLSEVLREIIMQEQEHAVRRTCFRRNKMMDETWIAHRCSQTIY